MHMYTHLPKQCKDHLLPPLVLGITQLVREYPVVSSNHSLIQQMGVQEITIMKYKCAYSMYVTCSQDECMSRDACMHICS